MIVDMNDALLDANPDAFLYGTLLMGGDCPKTSE